MLKIIFFSFKLFAKTLIKLILYQLQLQFPFYLLFFLKMLKLYSFQLSSKSYIHFIIYQMYR